MPAPITDRSPVIVELPMMMFLRLADSDGKMTAIEMERFDTLIASREWCRSPLLNRSLANTERGKAALWKQYALGEFRGDTDRVVASIDAVLRGLTPPERADLEHDLLHFCRELTDAAHRGAGVLRHDRGAEAEFEALLQLVRRPSSRTAQKAKSEALVQLPPESARVRSLSVAKLGSEDFWEGGKLSLRCVQVIDETHNVKTFRFVDEPPKLFSYRPGQFLTLEVPIDGKIIRRSYTISASPSRPHLISVTVKRFPDGLISTWLHEHLRVGSSLFADGPHGKFTCVGDDGPYLFISGGSGITPCMAMSRWLCDTAAGSDIHFLHFARTQGDLIFEDELRLMSHQVPGFRSHFVCTREGEDSDWTGAVGRISSELLTEQVPDLKNRSVYLCGPLEFMDVTHRILEEVGLDMARFHQEIFGGVPRRDPKAAEAQAGKAAKVVFSASNIEVDCKGSDYVLDLALARGLKQAFSCRAGQCGTCKVMLLEGAIEHDCADGLTPDDARDGFILSCQARPVGRVVVDL